MFTRTFHGDFDALLEAEDPICLVRFGDGEIAIIDGIAHQSADAWATKGTSWIRGDVIRSLRNDAPGWCVGLPSPCCLRNGVRIHPAIRIPQERVTFSTLFLHANLRSFPRVITRFADAITVGSWFGDIRVPADGVTVPWDIDACVAEIIAARRDVLLAAGLCSNVLALRYWDRVPVADRHFVLDVGSALDVAHGRTTRHFHTAMIDHFCKWGLPGSLANPRAPLQRVVARPTRDVTPTARREPTSDVTTAQRPEREPMPRAAPKLEQRPAMPKAEIRTAPARAPAPDVAPQRSPDGERIARPERRAPGTADPPSRSVSSPRRESTNVEVDPQRQVADAVVRPNRGSRPSRGGEPKTMPVRERTAVQQPKTSARERPSMQPPKAAATRERTAARPVAARERATAKPVATRERAQAQRKPTTLRPRKDVRPAPAPAPTPSSAPPEATKVTARQAKPKTLVAVRDRPTGRPAVAHSPSHGVTDTIVPHRSGRQSTATIETRPSAGGPRRPLELAPRLKPVTIEPTTRERTTAPIPIRMQSRAAGLHVVEPRDVKGDAIAVVVTKRPWLAAHVGRMLAWQTLRPSHVVVCSACGDYDTAPIKDALPDVPVVFVHARAEMPLGELRNIAMEAASALSNTAIMCTIDDDDCYGTHYLAGIVDAWQRHPIAVVVGLGSFETRTVDAPPLEPLTQKYRSRTGLRAAIGGATISIPTKVWRERTDLRYPEMGGSGEDIEFLATAQRENRVAAAYFGDFVALRYTDPAHGHTSANQGLPGTAR